METVMNIKCAWCGKDMGTKDGQGVTGVTHSICEDCSDEQRALAAIDASLRFWAIERDQKQAAFLKALKEVDRYV